MVKQDFFFQKHKRKNSKVLYVYKKNPNIKIVINNFYNQDIDLDF